MVYLWCGRTVARAGGRSVYGHVITKFSRMARFLTHGASRARAPLLSYKRRFKTTTKMDTHYWTRYVTVRWFSNIGLSVIGSLRIFKLWLYYKKCTCLTSCFAKSSCCCFFFLPGSAESLSSQSSFMLPLGCFITT